MTKDETKSALVPLTEGDARRDALMRALGFDRLNDGQRELALAISSQYDLDPMLRHVVMVDGKPYITRDGLLHVAHKSGVFDGIEVDPPTLDPDGKYWRTTARVYRKDFSRPFVYPGRYPANSGNVKYNEEMAIKVAEVMTLRRAFDVSAPVIEEQWDGEGIDATTPVQPSSLADKIAQRALAAGNSPEQARADEPDAQASIVGPETTQAPTLVPDEIVEAVASIIDEAYDLSVQSGEDVVFADEPEEEAIEEALHALVEEGALEVVEEEEPEPEPAPVVSPLRQPKPEPVEQATFGATTDDATAYDLFKVWAKDHDTVTIRAVAKELFPARTGFGQLNAGELGVVQHAVIKAEAKRDEAAASERCAAPSPTSSNRCTLDPNHFGVHRHGTRETWD